MDKASLSMLEYVLCDGDKLLEANAMGFPSWVMQALKPFCDASTSSVVAIFGSKNFKHDCDEMECFRARKDAW